MASHFIMVEGVMTSFGLDKLLPWLVLTVGLTTTYFLQQLAFNSAYQAQQDNFASQARDITRRIEERMADYEQILRGAKGLYIASETVERDEFHNYMDILHLADHYPGIQSVGYELIVPSQAKTSHIKAIRKEGFPNYTLRPVGERNLYVPVVYVEPFTGYNLRVFGYDTYSDAVRRAAMEQARDLDQSTLTGKVRLEQDTKQNAQAGCIMYLPVYRNGIPHETLAERRANIVGWLFAAFRMNDLMYGILGTQDKNVDFEIWDGENISLETLMYDNDRVYSPTMTKPSLYNSVQHIKVAGHQWTIKLRSLPAFEANLDTRLVTIIRLASTLLSVLLFLLVWQLIIGRTRALKLAKGMTRELRDSEERLKLAAASGQVGIWEYNIQTNDLVWDDTMFALYGARREDFSGAYDAWSTRLHPEDKAATETALQDAIAGIREYEPEFRVIWPDGEVHYLKGHARVIKDQTGNPVRVIGTNWDNRAHAQTQQQLKLEHTAINQSRSAFHRLGPDGQVIDVNDAACQSLGYTREEMLSMHVWEFEPDFSPEAWTLMWDGLRQTGLVSIETQHRRKDGTVFPVEVTTNYFTADGEEYGFSFVNDITERKRIEHELTITQTAIEKSRSAFYRVNAAGKVLYANDYACQSLGYTREELLNMHVWEFDPHFPPEAWAPMWDGLRQTKVVNIETQHQRKDGTVFPVEIIGNIVNAEEKEEYSFVFVHDITNRKQNEQRIQRLTYLYKALSEVNEAIVRMEHQAELFPLVCRCAVEFGSMKLAWIGQLEEASGMIIPVASHGDVTGYLNSLPVSSRADVAGGRGATGTALRENRAVIVNDYLNNPITAPWKKHAENLGWASAAAFPIQRGGRPYGVLTVCHALVNAFDEEAIVLLEEMSKDIAFALDNFDRETQRKAAEDSLRLAASVYETSSEAMSITDADGIILNVNPAFTKVTGYLPEEVVGKNSGILSSGRHDEAFYLAMWHDINTTGRWQGEIWDKRKNGEIYPNWLTVNTIYNEDGTVHRRVSLFSDITEWKKNEQLIWRQANFDSLTELPSRQMFRDRLAQDVKKAHRVDKPLALMLLDLDRFKEINDSLGHDKGDDLLKEAAQRISSCVRETDTVARLGGDEFTVILGELDDLASVERVAQDILRKLSEPFQLGKDVAYVSASIGITLYPEDASDIEVLIKNADQAMYAAKYQGRNRYSYFTASMQEAVQARMQIANDLRGALAGNQFWLAYQPIVELATGSIHKAEALLRWQHPARGLVSPATFIPVAEDTGLINGIGDWVFHEAVEQVKRWRTSLDPVFQISINKSPVQFRNERLSHQAWYDHLERLGLPGNSIVIEITEGLLLEASTLVTDRLLEFRDLGIQVSIDDFGTGYSALAYLKKFDIDYLKIDQSFVRNLAPGSDDLALCEAIIVMAHKLNMQVVAEGVETAEQKNLLMAAGCDYGQGYLFSRPIPANEFEALWQKL